MGEVLPHQRVGPDSQYLVPFGACSNTSCSFLHTAVGVMTSLHVLGSSRSNVVISRTVASAKALSMHLKTARGKHSIHF